MGGFQILALVAIFVSTSEGFFFNPSPDPGQPMYSLDSLYGLVDAGFAISRLLNQKSVGVNALASGAANGIAGAELNGYTPYASAAQTFYETAPEDRPDFWSSLSSLVEGVPKSAKGGSDTFNSFIGDVAEAVGDGGEGSDLLVDVGKSIFVRGQEFGSKTFEPVAQHQINLAGSVLPFLPFVISHFAALIGQPFVGLLNILGNNLAQNVNDVREDDEFPTLTPYYVNPPYPYPEPYSLYSFS